MVETGGGEDLDGGNTANITPVVAVRGERNGGVVVGYVFVGKELGSVRKNYIKLGEEFLGNGGRGD